MKKYLPYILALILAAFALLTFFLSGSVIFDLFGIRAKEGNYVLFIVWANFICSIIYFAAVLGFIKQKKCTVRVLGLAFFILLSAFTYFNYYISEGGIYETKTYGAMIFRLVVTTIFTLLAYFTINKNNHRV